MIERERPFDSSAIVAAHPDDEVLWFGSVLGSVQRALVCYEDCDELPELGPARRELARAYPLANVEWLRHAEPCSLGAADWSDPIATEFGMALNAGDQAAKSARYESSYRALRFELRERLWGVAEVFTHNPWGEYGHPDHVQVSRVVASLREELGFQLWYSNYVSPRSMPFAAQFLPRLVSGLRLPVDAALVLRVKAAYESSRCWTWHASYQPPPEESFLEDTHALHEGAARSLNCVLP